MRGYLTVEKSLASLNLLVAGQAFKVMGMSLVPSKADKEWHFIVYYQLVSHHAMSIMHVCHN